MARVEENPEAILRHKAGERHHAVAVRDGADLFLFLDICRGPLGDVYLNFPRPREPGWNPHASKHASGQSHQKSFGHKAQVSHRQKRDATFRGTENIVDTVVSRDEPRALNIPCQITDFQNVMEIPIDDLSPEKYRTHISVDITEPNGAVSTLGTKRQAAVFQDAVPWIVVTLYEA